MRYASRSLGAVALGILGAALVSARADVLTWTAANTGDWFVVENWTNTTTPESTRVPADGDAAVIANAGATVLLTNSSAALGSLLVSNATLSFSNWNTLLSATNLTVEKSGVLTCSGPFTNFVMSNRVNLVCDTLFVAAGGAIDVNNKGFIGARGVGSGSDPLLGSGPGVLTNYAGAYTIYGGAGHGGFGVSYAYADNPDNTYGSGTEPMEPGSGGSCYPSQTYMNGGDGGGAVRIMATNVVVNGTISADSSRYPSTGSGGSGGSVFITCSTITGTNGLISANGGNAHLTTSIAQGGGGGGRVAVVYDTEAQALLPVPSIRFAAHPGRSSQSATYYPYLPGDIGTLYFPDAAFFSPTNLFTGQWLGPVPSSLTFSDWSVSNVWARLPGFALTVSNTLTVMGTNADTCKLELMDQAVVNCGDLRINRGSLVLGHAFGTNGPTLTCANDMVLTNYGRLHVAAGLTNSGMDTNYGAQVNVGGDIHVFSNSWIYPSAHATNGTVPLFTMRNIMLSEGGGIDASGRGYAGGKRAGTTVGNVPFGPGRAALYNAGSGYGGVGGTGTYSVASAGGPAYGNSNYPVAPGSGARAGSASLDVQDPSIDGPYGGGSVQIRAVDTATVNGHILANSGQRSTRYGPGASGGGIYIRCKTFIGSPNGLIQANGGISGYGPAYPGGPGGGGRIAVWRVNDLSEGVISNTADPGARYGVTGGVGTIVWGWLPSAGTIITLH